MTLREGTGSERYGQFYWCAKVNKALAKTGEIYVYADQVRIIEGGLGFFRCRDNDEEQINLLIAPGQWTVAFVASVLDGGAVAVEHWVGEVVEPA